MRSFSSASVHQITQPSSALDLLCEGDYMEKVCQKLYPEKPKLSQLTSNRLLFHSQQSGNRAVSNFSNYNSSINSQNRVQNFAKAQRYGNNQRFIQESRELLISGQSKIRSNIENEARKLIFNVEDKVYVEPNENSSRINT